MKFTAVAFDLDGTLYPNHRFYLRLIPFILKEQRLLRAMGKARNQLRGSYRKPLGHSDFGAANSQSDFYLMQAEIMGGLLKEPAEDVKERTERLIYRGWEPIFKKISIFPFVRETLDTFRKAGIKLCLLSDFPPEKKLENLNLSGYWDTVFCSEITGHLKPHSAPFFELSSRIGKPAGEILYVGNSVSYDIKGAGEAGMKTALLKPSWKKLIPFAAIRRAGIKPDFSFFDYRQLCDFVLN